MLNSWLGMLENARPMSIAGLALTGHTLKRQCIQIITVAASIPPETIQAKTLVRIFWSFIAGKNILPLECFGIQRTPFLGFLESLNLLEDVVRFAGNLFGMCTAGGGKGGEKGPNCIGERGLALSDGEVLDSMIERVEVGDRVLEVPFPP